MTADTMIPKLLNNNTATELINISKDIIPVLDSQIWHDALLLLLSYCDKEDDIPDDQIITVAQGVAQDEKALETGQTWEESGSNIDEDATEALEALEAQQNDPLKEAALSVITTEALQACYRINLERLLDDSWIFLKSEDPAEQAKGGFLETIAFSLIQQQEPIRDRFLALLKDSSVNIAV